MNRYDPYLLTAEFILYLEINNITNDQTKQLCDDKIALTLQNK